MRRVYRYRLYPTRQQREGLNRQLRFACDLYNAALEQRRHANRHRGVSVGYHAQSAELTELRHEAPELLPPAGMNYWCQQAILRQLDHAFSAFFRRLARGEQPGYPRFKSHRRFDTLTWTLKGNAGGVAITEHGRLRLQGIGAVKVKWHRPIPADATLAEVKVTRSSDGQRFNVAFYAELSDPKPRPSTGEVVGIDLGVRRLVSLSTGERFEGPRAGKAASAATRRAARKVARRERGSNRRRKAAARLARQREREANRRRDAAHKLSRILVDRFDLISHEALAVRNMIRSASGTRKEPGTNVAAKRALNREISDAGWSQMLSFLAYKAEEAGRRVVTVPATNTSRTCAACRKVDKRNRKGARFHCVTCGHNADADVNAAQVILGRALAGESIQRPGRGRQAPTETAVPVA